MLWGDDFAFENASFTYEFIDGLISLINNRSQAVIGKQVVAFYSNVSSYIQSKQEDGTEFETYRGDFLPYAQLLFDSNWDYWTGYYSSRPGLKQSIRDMMRRLLSVRSELSLRVF